MIRILTTSFNGSPYLNLPIMSLQSQGLKDWKCYITDDMSTDNSREILKELTHGDPRFELIFNEKKMYQPGNYWQVLQKEEIDDNDICITLDGDDWLSGNDVLERVVKYYDNDNVWLTCGQFVHFHGPSRLTAGFTKKPDFTNLRKVRWTASHMRTFRAGLFRKIKKEDLIAPNGEFWEVTGDLSFMYPMLEMAGEDRCKFVTEVNYFYNVETPLNDYKVNYSKQLEYANLIRNKDPYDIIDNYNK